MVAQVTISGNTYDVYVSVATVDAYAAGSLTADAWSAMVANDKARVLVSVTRWIDSECWQGEKVDPDQPLAWPRTVGDIAAIELAVTQLAVLVAANPSLPDQSMGLVTVAADGGTKRLKAGSVELEYFRALNFSVYGTGTVAPFPQGIMNKIGQWLCANTGGSAWGLSGSVSYGTCEPSVTGRRNRFGFVEPL